MAENTLKIAKPEQLTCITPNFIVETVFLAMKEEMYVKIDLQVR